MNTFEILQTLCHLNARHVGVYAVDRLPMVWTRSTAIIANTDEHDRPGRHWVAFYIDEHGRGTYFDSYGTPPHADRRFFLRLRQNSTAYQWNTRMLKGMFSQTCGQYCCVFLYYLSHGYSLKQFLQFFANDFNRNDELIVRLFRKIFLHDKNKRAKQRSIYCVILNHAHVKTYNLCIYRITVLCGLK